MPQLRLQVLGGPYVELNGQIVSLSHHKAMALLIYLAVTGQRHSRAALAALLWPDYDATAARGQLRRMLWVINKSLGKGWLETDRQSVHLPSQPNLWLDVAQFRHLLATSYQHQHPNDTACSTCIETLTTAVALAQDEFLASFTLPDSSKFETWQQFETESLRRELAGALEHLVQLLSRPGETSIEEAIIYTRQWLALDPLHEPAHCQLMTLYAWSGQPTAALQQYHTCAHILEQELGIPPSPETTALFEAIKANRLRPAYTGPPTLKGSTVPSPLSPDLSLSPHKLPVQATPFIGRLEEVPALQSLIAHDDRRLVTLVGPGGIGKTSLAVRAVGELEDSFRDGTYFVALAPLNAADQIIQAIVEALGISVSSGGDLRQLLFRYLRRRQLLLLLDNFEHLLDGAPLLTELLQATPGVTLVATSREKLNLTVETVFNVSGLGIADWQSPEELLAHSAGELFVRSAQRADPDFELRTDDVRPVARICRLVEGMPLGILLAAAWVDQFTPQGIADEVSQSLDFLETEMRDVPPRQRSVRAVFDSSWEHLSEAERELFKKLSIFRDGFTRPAAREVAGASMRELAGLVNKSFLRRNPGSGRYEVHELLRQFASERLDAAPEVGAAVREAHTDYFAGQMEQLLDPLKSARQRATLDEIEADIENVRSAWRRLAEQGGSADMNRMIETLWYFHEIRGWYHAGLDLFGAAEAALLTSASAGEAEVVVAQILGIRGGYTTTLGSPMRGLEMAQEGVATLRRLDRRKERLVPLLGILAGNAYLNQIDEAIRSIQELLDIAANLGLDWWEADGSGSLASVYMAAGSYEEARRYAEKSAKKWSQIGDPWGSFWPAQVLAGLAALDGNYEEAKERYRLVLEMVQSINFRRGMHYTYYNLGSVNFWLKDYRKAESLYLQTLAISDEIGQTREMLAAIYEIARVWAATERASGALELLAVVLQHPVRSQHTPFRKRSIQEQAEELRSELAGRLPPETYAATWARGTVRELQSVVDEVLTNGSPALP